MIVVVWAQRVVQLRDSHDNKSFQLKLGDILLTFKHENW